MEMLMDSGGGVLRPCDARLRAEARLNLSYFWSPKRTTQMSPLVVP